MIVPGSSNLKHSIIIIIIINIVIVMSIINIMIIRPTVRTYDNNTMLLADAPLG